MWEPGCSRASRTALRQQQQTWKLTKGEATESPRNCFQFSMHTLIPKDMVCVVSPNSPVVKRVLKPQLLQRCSQTLAGNAGPWALVVAPRRENLGLVNGRQLEPRSP